MSEKSNISPQAKTNKISISRTISQSYLFFMEHFFDFVRLSFVPMIVWVSAEFLCDYLMYYYGAQLNPTVPRAMASAAFALVWYRQFLMGAKHATYLQLIDHVLRPGVFDLSSLFFSVFRIVLTSIILFVPTLLLSVSLMLYQYSRGVLIDNEAVQTIAIQSTTAIILLFSPVLVRLSFYTVGAALGRRRMSMRNIWRGTSGYTVSLWLLMLRAFLPITLYTYFITWAFEKIANRLAVDFMTTSLLVNIPSAFFTFMLLAIVVGVNGEAFKHLFGIRTSPRD